MFAYQRIILSVQLERICLTLVCLCAVVTQWRGQNFVFEEVPIPHPPSFSSLFLSYLPFSYTSLHPLYTTPFFLPFPTFSSLALPFLRGSGFIKLAM